jgi:hypothetical protein
MPDLKTTDPDNGGFLPLDYMDEAVPPARPHPNDWIIRLADGAPALAPDCDEGRPMLLADGDIVKFCQLTNYGGATLTLYETSDEDRDTLSIDYPMPKGAENVMVLADPDTLSCDVGDVAYNLRESGCSSGEYPIIYYTWSSGEEWRFDAATGKFYPREAPAF